MAKKMLIDATHPEETRVVVVDGNKVEDFDFESINKRQLAGNIYLAKVTRVEPSLQAAFVEYGGNRHGFLAFSEIHPDYYQIPIADREALLAEEEREEEERRAREEPEAEKPARKPRKRTPRGRKDKDQQESATTEDDAAAVTAVTAVAGLEVIDIEEGDTAAASIADAGDAVPKGLEIAEPEPDAPEFGATAEETPAAEVQAEATPEDVQDEPVVDPVQAVEAEADEPETEVAGAEEPATVAEEELATQDANADTETAAESPSDSSDDPDAPPRSMAESAGLDDEDRVSEDIAEPDGSAPRKTEFEADVAEQTEPSAVDAVETEESPTEDAPVQPDQQVEASDQDSAKSPENTENKEQSNSSEEGDSTDSETEEQPKKPRRRRSRSRKKVEDDTQTDDGDDEDDGAEVEQVGAEDVQEEVAASRTRLRRKYKIQDVIKMRQILLVQVVKEERGNKGAALTTYLSLAGRYCVLMPNTARGGGISRKIVNASDRKRLREITGELEVPKGMGLIVRTAGAERTRPEIKRDYEFLTRQWEQIRELTLKSVAPALIYEEGSLIKRSIRDIYSKEIDQILVEGEEGYREAKEYMKMLMPSHAKNVQRYEDSIPLFSRYQVESYLNGMFNPTVQLRSGGYIVIGVTEALVAIDVNSGRATKQGSIEETALQTNLEAAEEVARQLRLRDLAGLIVIDFIDMDENRNNRAVEKRMKDRLKNDRARIQVGRISAFGLMEMSRQRLRPGMLEATTQLCPTCQGMGLVRSDENLTLSILREIEEEGVRSRTTQITIKVPVPIANYLINHKRETLAQMEERHGVSVAVLADPLLSSPDYEIERSKTQTHRPERPQAAAVVTSASVISESDMVEDAEVVETREEDEGRNKKRRGKRGGRRRRGEDNQGSDENSQDSQGDVESVSDETSETEDGNAEERKRSRRGGRRRRGGRNRRNDENGQFEDQNAAGSQSVDDDATQSDSGETKPIEEAQSAPIPAEASNETVTEAASVETQAPDEPAPEAEAASVTEVAPEVESVGEAVVAEPHPELETAVEAPAAEPVVAEAEPEPAPPVEEAKPDEPPKPKRKGWWSFSR